MNVLLIYPEFPDTFWSFKHALKFIRKRALSPPLGLLTVAALLPDTWHKRLVDLNVTPRLKEQDLAWADMVFVSAMIVQRSSAHEVIRRCNAAGVRVVAGGPLFIAEHQDFPEVDHFVLNEAEITLPPFLRDLEAGRPQRMYATAEFADIEQTPAPQWELLNLKRYASHEHPVLARLPLQLRFLQRHGTSGPPAAHQERGAGDRRNWMPSTPAVGAGASSLWMTTSSGTRPASNASCCPP